MLLSCSGEDGERGIQGEVGDAGINCWDTNGDGMNQTSEDTNNDGEFNALDCQGDNGTNGADGNANVQSLDFDLTQFENDEVNISFENISEITGENITNKAIFFYLIGTSEGSEIFMALPGRDPFLNVQYDILYDSSGTIVMVITDDNGNSAGLFQGLWETLRVIIVDINPDALAGKSPTQQAKAYLSELGVDPSNYTEMKNHFGLQ